jgi:hypothetical protein
MKNVKIKPFVLSVTFKPILLCVMLSPSMLSVFMMSVIMLSVPAPSWENIHKDFEQ